MKQLGNSSHRYTETVVEVRTEIIIEEFIRMGIAMVIDQVAMMVDGIDKIDQISEGIILEEIL